MKSCPVKPISGLHHLASLSSPSSFFPSPSTVFLLPLLCSRFHADLANYLSVFSPHLCSALSAAVSLSCSWNRSISVTLCEHASPPPPPLHPPPPPLIDLFFLLPLPSLPLFSSKCAWAATLIVASLMFARMPPTPLPCPFLPDVAQKRGIRDLTVPSALFSAQSFVLVWNLCSVYRTPQMLSSSPASLSFTHHPAPISRSRITGELLFCSIPSAIYVLPFSIIPSWG